jgi:hypothetical protein
MGALSAAAREDWPRRHARGPYPPRDCRNGERHPCGELASSYELGGAGAAEGEPGRRVPARDGG